MGAKLYLYSASQAKCEDSAAWHVYSQLPLPPASRQSLGLFSQVSLAFYPHQSLQSKLGQQPSPPHAPCSSQRPADGVTPLGDIYAG